MDVDLDKWSDYEYNKINVSRNKVEGAEILCNIKPLISHRMLDNLQTYEEKKKSKRNGVLKRETCI